MRHRVIDDATIDPRRATGEPVRWGVVSTGHIARVVTEQLRSLEDAQVHAVSSRGADRARTFARDVGAARAYHDDGAGSGVEHMAADDAVDVVYVAAPHGQHHAIARTLLGAGKHVLLEKAFTVTAAEAEDLVALARSRGRFLMEALWTRFLPVYEALVEHLGDGAIGTPRWAQADLGMAARFDPTSRLWAREAGGGALLDLAVYPLTWTAAAFGLPSEVRAHGILAENGVDAMTSLDLGHPGGERAQVVVSLVSAHTRSATIAGDAGTVRMLAPLPNPPGFIVARGDETLEVRPALRAPPYAYQLREVTRCVQRGALESERMPLADSLSRMRLFDDARRQIGVRYANDEVSPGR